MQQFHGCLNAETILGFAETRIRSDVILLQDGPSMWIVVQNEGSYAVL